MRAEGWTTVGRDLDHRGQKVVLVRAESRSGAGRKSFWCGPEVILRDAGVVVRESKRGRCRGTVGSPGGEIESTAGHLESRERRIIPAGAAAPVRGAVSLVSKRRIDIADGSTVPDRRPARAANAVRATEYQPNSIRRPGFSKKNIFI
ncbi:MAG: hypothetical protein JSS81_09210 [Acidobacteria bacterium]|nr:hypothetical protein [Acidobacteriota bacterium]